MRKIVYLCGLGLLRLAILCAAFEATFEATFEVPPQSASKSASQSAFQSVPKSASQSAFQKVFQKAFQSVFQAARAQEPLSGSPCPGMEFKQFFYDNGQVSSEGCMKNGMPEGEWRNYDINGVLVSRGSRKNLKLEGVWTFYKEGKPVSEITYEQDRKNGPSRTITENGILLCRYINDTLQGIRTLTDTSGHILLSTPFKDGVEEGLERRYNTYGDAVVFTLYKNGMTVFRKEANIRDGEGRRQGLWTDYHFNGNLHWECPYKDDLKDGYYKLYDTAGNLILMEKYANGEKEENVPELEEIKVHTEYYTNGRPKYRVTYKQGKPDGLCREYDSVTGKVVRGIVFKEGEIVGTEILDERGNKSEEYVERYPDGKLKCRGRMFRGKRYGSWKFYYPDGKIEQEGEYRNGRYEGEWVWYYPEGSVRLEQEYYQGRPDGKSVEYDMEGHIVAKGSYLEGMEDGRWVYNRNGELTEGAYAGGERDGVWRSWWNDGKHKKMSFEGRYTSGLPDGMHRYYYEDGSLKEEGLYRLGERRGTWMKYDRDGNVVMRVTYDTETGEESRYNGRRTVTKEEEQAYREETGE